MGETNKNIALGAGVLLFAETASDVAKYYWTSSHTHQHFLKMGMHNASFALAGLAAIGTGLVIGEMCDRKGYHPCWGVAAALLGVGAAIPAGMAVQDFLENETLSEPKIEAPAKHNVFNDNTMTNLPKNTISYFNVGAHLKAA